MGKKGARRAVPVIIIVLAGVVALLALGWIYIQRDTTVTSAQPAADSSAPLSAASASTTKAPTTNLLNRVFSQGRCKGTGTTTLSVSPMRPEDVEVFIPLGQMVKGHVTPIDHQYLYPAGWKNGGAEVPIYAPGNGTIVMVNRFPLEQVEGHLGARDGYDIVIEYSCDFYSKLGLLTSLADDIAKKVGSIERGKQKYVRIPVKAGEQVAWVGRQSLDLFTYDTSTPKKQWIVPTHYNDGDGEKKYITDVLLYLNKKVVAQLLAKNPRMAAPRGGRFDYDIDGRLVGTWFLKGSGGYFPGPSVQNYWKNHLVFAYNELDPSSVEISIGSWDGDDTGHQFAAMGNAPDPKDISVKSSTVAYELAQAMFTTQDGQPWNQIMYVGPVKRAANSKTAGILLVQMLGERQIKIERFPGKRASEVSGFTSAAQLYER